MATQRTGIGQHGDNRYCNQSRFLLYARPLVLFMYISLMDLKQLIPDLRSIVMFSTESTFNNRHMTFTQHAVNPDHMQQPTNSSSPIIENDNDTFMGIKARAWEKKWQNGDIPCFPPSLDLPRSQGLLYNKLLKTGGSTGAGINARIAWNQAKRINATFASCDGNLKHAPAHIMCPHRNRNTSFLWTTVRQATSRIVSQFFFFDVSRYKNEPTDQRFVDYVRENAFDQSLMATCNHYVKLLSTDKMNQSQFRQDPTMYISRILEEYDFISVTERMEESAVTLAMLLGLPLADVLYLNAKQNGGYDEGGFQNRCTYIEPSFTSRGMKDFMQTNRWFVEKCIHWDNVLHTIANRSLDLTIETTLGGRQTFELQLEKFRRAQKLAQERCQHTTKMPCTAQGVKLNYTETDCLWADSGCGYKCLNDISTEFDLWKMEY